MSTTDNPTGTGLDFVRDLVRADIEAGTFGGRVQTRFPPEPNGYLHIGHAKAISIDYGIAEEFGGVCNLRFDDTNPDTEDIEFAGSIIDDLTWLGFSPGEPLYASDYFEQLYVWAEHLVNEGLAYVDDQDGETISAQRGGYGRPGVESPFRGALRRREPRPAPADACRGVRRRRASAACQDRHAGREHAVARSGDVPHSPRPSLANR